MPEENDNPRELAALRPYLPLAQVELSRLGRYLPPDVDRETLEERALQALLAAARERNPQTPGFAAHARLVIWRALTECLRESRFFLPQAEETLGRLADAVGRALRPGGEVQPEQLAALLDTPGEKLHEDLGQVAALLAGMPQAVFGGTPGASGDQWEPRLAWAICALPPLEQQVVTLYYLEDMTFGDLAQTLDLSPPEVEYAFGRAAVLLRLRLREDHAAAWPGPTS